MERALYGEMTVVDFSYILSYNYRFKAKEEWPYGKLFGLGFVKNIDVIGRLIGRIGSLYTTSFCWAYFSLDFDNAYFYRLCSVYIAKTEALIVAFWLLSWTYCYALLRNLEFSSKINKKK